MLFYKAWIETRAGRLIEQRMPGSLISPAMQQLGEQGRLLLWKCNSSTELLSFSSTFMRCRRLGMRRAGK